MEFQIEGNPDYGHLVISLGPGDRVFSEGGSMAWMSDGVDVKARLLGGFLPALVRKITGGESLFVGEYTHPTNGEVVFSPRVPGQIGHRSLADDSFILTGGAYMASTPEINLRTRFGGLKALFSGEGLFLMECSGRGDLFFNTYGALIEREVENGFTVDTGHVVGWESTVSYSIRGMGSLKSTLTSGEGLAMRFTGQGKVFLQTRTLDSAANWLMPFLPQ